jgi:hypothetical protein
MSIAALVKAAFVSTMLDITLFLVQWQWHSEYNGYFLVLLLLNFIGSADQGRDIVMHPEMSQSLAAL